MIKPEMYDFVGTDADYDELAAIAAQGSVDDIVCVGPLVWQPSDGPLGKSWYFVNAICQETGLSTGTIAIGDEINPGEPRARFIKALERYRPRLTVLSMQDEVDAARLCETLWPSKETTALRRDVEKQRKADRRKYGDKIVASWAHE